MQKRKLGALEVSALGLGCMGMSEFYGTADEARSKKTIQEAYEQGITFFDTADMYGIGGNEKLLGEAVKGFRDQIVLATKFGIVRKKEDPEYRRIEGKPAYVKQQCEESLKNLGVSSIDLYYQHRVDSNTPIEETVQAMAELVKEGKVKYLGLSEMTVEQLRRAHAVHPITAVQSEYSLWNKGPEEGVLQACKELNIGFVAYSPIARGLFSGKLKVDGLQHNDFRRTLPRFQGENYDYNMQIVQVILELAQQKKCTPTQLALAWVAAQRDFIVPLFGTTRPEHLHENIASLQVKFSPEELEKLSNLASPKGERYGPTTLNMPGLGKNK